MKKQEYPAKWSVNTDVTPQDRNLAADCNISPVLVAILRARGYTDADSIRDFIAPRSNAQRDPFTLPDIESAIERLHRAIINQEQFLIYGDYDVDGITSAALLVRALRKLKAKVLFTLPERSDGYGLNNDVIEKAAKKGIKLIFTADCGITDHEPVQLANERGIDVIITDHHDPSSTLPPALAVVNPKRADAEYGFTGLSGCGVAYKVLQAMISRYWPQFLKSFSQNYLDFVAMAAIADCVPLVDENRYLAHEGLKVLLHSKKKGLRALMAASGIEDGKPLAGNHIGFRLGPRLNAAGRMASPRQGVKLLLSDDEEECEKLAAELDELNTKRQQITQGITDAACEKYYKSPELQKQSILVIDGEGWSHGLIGIVASRLVERFHRPVIIIGVVDGVARGSGRSYADFDLHSLIEHTRHLLEAGGGHAAACGFTISPQKIDEFRAVAQKFAKKNIDPAFLVPIVEADCATAGKDITPQLVEALQALEPCGTGNPEAKLMLKNAVLKEGRSMGKEQQHVKWFVEADGVRFECVWWNPGKKADGFAPEQRVDICYVPSLNTWRNNVTLQLRIKAARHAK